MSDNQRYKTPEKVALAIKLFYLIIGISIVRTAITVVRHWDVRTPDFLIFSSIFIWLISIFLVYMTGKGKNWARWVMVTILTISIPLSILPMFSSLVHTPIPNLLGLVQVLLYVWALVLLFHTASSTWFKK